MNARDSVHLPQVFRDCIALGVLPFLAVPLIGAGMLSGGCTTEPLDIPCPEIAEGELVVSEMHASQTGQYGEWLEVYNASSRTIDLQGLRVKVIRLDGGSSTQFLVRSALSLAPEQYIVFGNQPGAGGDHVDYDYFSDIASQSTSENPKLLYDTGAIELESCGERIDLLVYRNLPSTGSLVLDGDVPPDAVDNDNEVNWCVDNAEDAMSEELGIRGTPQEENPICPE
jgi:hypothetical protein